MDQSKLEERHLKAGSGYLTALQKLGLDPEGLFWAYDEAARQHVLVLVTSLYDFAGPLELSKTLFKAYAASVTPQEIDPFVIRLHSPEHAIIRQFAEIGALDEEFVDSEGRRSTERAATISYRGGGMTVTRPLIYKWMRKRRNPVADLSRRWTRFARTVDRVAA
jgi:hypothetical protein